MLVRSLSNFQYPSCPSYACPYISIWVFSALYPTGGGGVLLHISFMALILKLAKLLGKINMVWGMICGAQLFLKAGGMA